MPPPDFSQRKDVRKAEKIAAQAEAARISYTKRIMSEVEGRQWMHALLERCHVFHTPFVRSSPDLTAFNCGEQNIGYQTFRDVVVHCSMEYVLMMQEANIREISHGRREQPEPDRSHAGEPERSTDPGRNVEGSESDLDPTVWNGTEDEYGRLPE